MLFLRKNDSGGNTMDIIWKLWNRDDTFLLET